MTRVWTRAITGAVGAIMLSVAVAGAASAHPHGFGGHGFGGHGFGGHPIAHAVGHGFGHRHGFRGGYVVGLGDLGYGYGGCSYLRHRAEDTGSPYWWHRYEACVGG